VQPETASSFYPTADTQPRNGHDDYARRMDRHRQRDER
jgi:hypothetical protein